MTTLVAPAELRFRAMGSDAHVLVNGPAGLLQVARDRVEKLERRWSRFRPDSEISRLNALAGSPMAVSPETLGLMGGIGKGYAADLVVEELRAAGAAGVCVNLGGDLRAEGRAPGGGSWVVGIEHPLRPGPAATVTLAGGAVATSSRIRRAWGPAGDRRHHLIDPVTGWPAGSGLAAVTVLAARGWQAEVLAKAAFLGGLDRGRALLTAAGADGLLVDDHGRLHPSGGFARFLSGGGAESEVRG